MPHELMQVIKRTLDAYHTVCSSRLIPSQLYYKSLLVEKLRARRSYIFIAMLVHSQVDRPKRASPNLLLDHVLIDAQNRSTIIPAVGIL